MAQWGGTEEVDRGATCQPWLWERRTWTILTLVGMAGVGLLTWSNTGGASTNDAHAALAALLVYVTLCILIVHVDRVIKGHERAARVAREERRRRLRRRPYRVVDEAEAVLVRAQGQRETR